VPSPRPADDAPPGLGIYLDLGPARVAALRAAASCRLRPAPSIDQSSSLQLGTDGFNVHHQGAKLVTYFAHFTTSHVGCAERQLDLPSDDNYIAPSLAVERGLRSHQSRRRRAPPKNCVGGWCAGVVCREEHHPSVQTLVGKAAEEASAALAQSDGLMAALTNHLLAQQAPWNRMPRCSTWNAATASRLRHLPRQVAVGYITDSTVRNYVPPGWPVLYRRIAR
jgi:hypothetical protein